MATQPSHTDPALYYLCSNNNPANPRWRVVKETDKFFWVQERSDGVQTWKCTVEKRSKSHLFGDRCESTVVEQALNEAAIRKMAVRAAATHAIKMMEDTSHALRRILTWDHHSEENLTECKAVHALALEMQKLLTWR